VTDIAAVILAGGHGERLGGIIKADLLVGGQSLLQRTVHAIGGSVSKCVVATGRAPPVQPHKSLQITCCQDVDDAPPGPVRGLIAAAREFSRGQNAPDYLLSVAVDTPLLPGDLVEVLLREMCSCVDVAMCTFGEQVYPTNALWRLAALNALDMKRQNGKKRNGLRHLFPSSRIERVAFDEQRFGEKYLENPFRNVNTLADIAYFARRFANAQNS